MSYREGQFAVGGGEPEPRNLALWEIPTCTPALRAPHSAASPSPGRVSKELKRNTRYKFMAQISLCLTLAGGHPCSGIPKIRENRFQIRDQWTLGIKGHPWGQTGSDRAQGMLGRRLKRREREKKKREGRREREEE